MQIASNELGDQKMVKFLTMYRKMNAGAKYLMTENEIGQAEEDNYERQKEWCNN